MTAAVLYFFYDNAEYARLLGPLLGFEQKYSKLLVLCAGVLVVGCGAFLIGMATRGPRSAATAAPSGVTPAWRHSAEHCAAGRADR
jgi:hypothetical protein